MKNYLEGIDFLPIFAVGIQKQSVRIHTNIVCGYIQKH